MIKNKMIPDYPTTNTSPQVLTIGANGGSLSWSDNGLFNVINASEIINNTLTPAQYDLITNGKPTIVSGDYNGVSIFFKPYLGGADFIKGWCIANDALTSYQVFRTSKQIGLNGKSNYIAGVYSFNGKTIPSYPSSTGTFVLKCINGTLTWVEETQTPTGIYIEE